MVNLLQEKHFPDNMLELLVDICTASAAPMELPGAAKPPRAEDVMVEDTETPGLQQPQTGKGSGGKPSNGPEQ